MSRWLAVLCVSLACATDRASTADTGSESGTGDSGETAPESTGESSSESGGEVFCEACPTNDGDAECRDRIDNDGDGLVDLNDPECLIPCDNAEKHFDLGLWMVSPSTCNQNCFVDLIEDYYGAKVEPDQCLSHLECEPLFDHGCWEPVPPPNACGMGQVEECLETCLPAIPNGCDCFGCCEVEAPGGRIAVQVHENNVGALCTRSTVDDCDPCVPRLDCFNPCEPEKCEWCFGDASPPEGCGPATCAGQPCTIAPDGTDDCEDPCAYCSQGCCLRTPVWE